MSKMLPLSDLIYIATKGVNTHYVNERLRFAPEFGRMHPRTEVQLLQWRRVRFNSILFEYELFPIGAGGFFKSTPNQ
jgi:hypothetical protein